MRCETGSMYCICVCRWKFMGVLLHVWYPAGELATHTHTDTCTISN